MKTLSSLTLALLSAALAHGQRAAPSTAAAVLALARQNAPIQDDPDARDTSAARFLALMDRLGAAPAPTPLGSPLSWKGATP